MNSGTVAAWAATASAVIAAGQICLSRRDSNRRAALDNLRYIDERLHDLWGDDDLPAIRNALLDCYRCGNAVSDGGQRYLAFLNALDMLATAVEYGLVDRKLAVQHIKTLCRAEVVSLTFVREFQTCCGDDAVYEHLAKLLVAVGEVRRENRSA